MRAFDQAWNVRDGDPLVTRQLNHSDVRRQRRERIGRDLGVRRRDLAEQRGLAGVRITDQARIRDLPQLQIECSPLTLFAFRVLGGRAVPRTLEMDIPDSALASTAKDEFLTRVGEIGDHFKLFRVERPALSGRRGTLPHVIRRRLRQIDKG